MFQIVLFGSGISSYLSVPTDTSHVPPERNDFLLLDHILEVGGCPVECHALDGLSRLAGVLEKAIKTLIGHSRDETEVCRVVTSNALRHLNSAAQRFAACCHHRR